jgi:hypothetical protein
MTLCLLLQAATRTQAGEIAVQGALQKPARGIAGAPGRSRHGPLEAAACEIECGDNSIEEADRIILDNGVVEALGEADHFVAMCPLEMAHGGTRLRDRKEVSFHSSQVDVLYYTSPVGFDTVWRCT